jgi:hypothetical protein
MTEPDSFGNLFKFYMKVLTAILAVTLAMFLATCAGAFGQRVEQNMKEIKQLETRVLKLEKRLK